MKISATIVFVAGLAMAGCAAGPGQLAGSSADLTGDEWVVDQIGERDVIADAPATLRFEREGRLSGDTSCNRYFASYKAEGAMLRIENPGMTKRACEPAVMDQESRFLQLLNAVSTYRVDKTGALLLSTPTGATITARRAASSLAKTTYRCSDGSVVEAWYPTTNTAKIRYQGRSLELTSAISASGARYIGSGWQWWTKGLTEGLLAPLADGESIASAPGVTCTAS